MVTSTHLNLLLEILLKTYFFNSRCLLVFTDSKSSFQTVVQIPIIYLKVYNNTLRPEVIFQHFGCQDVIISHENASTMFTEFEQWIRLKNERFNTRRYVLTGKNALEVFGTKELQHVSDLLVVVPKKYDSNTEGYDLVTHVYGKMNTSDFVKVVDRWFLQNQSFLYGYDLFQDKLSNQNGRTIVIGTFTYEPYSVVENDTIAGTESSFVLEFLKKYNLTKSVRVIPGDDYWGDIYDNWTGFGILGAVAQDEVELGYGSVYSWDAYYQFLDYTRPLVRTGVTALVPSPELEEGWLTPLYSFSLEMWVAVLVVFLSGSVVLSAIFYMNRTYGTTSQTEYYFNDSLITMVRMYLLQSVKVHINGNLMKYFLAMNMINALFISSSYSSGFSSVMTVPRYEKAIKTVEDLAEAELPWGANTDAWLISLRSVNEKDYKIIKNNFVVNTDQGLITSSRRHNFGFALERLPYGHYAIGTYVHRDIISHYQIMQEDIYWEQCILLVRKNSVLLPLLDNLILRVFEAGLVAYWENEAVANYMDMSVQRGIMYHFQEHGIVTLRWVHVEGAFALLAIGYVASMLAFFGEHLKFRVKRPATNIFLD